jgi:hypothetical protein
MYTEKRSFLFLEPLVANFLTDAKSCLYIGFRADSSTSFMDDLKPYGINNFYILEIFPANFKSIQNLSNTTLIPGDVRNVKQLCKEFNIQPDLTLWAHGPEHLEEKYLDDVLQDLTHVTKQLVLCSAPYGHHPQGSMYGNKHEAHVTTFGEQIFQRNGYNCMIFKPCFFRGNGEIVGYSGGFDNPRKTD